MNLKALTQLKKHKGKVVWLSSYPKCGNTWVRAFFTALFTENEIDINHLINDYGFYSKDVFEDSTGLEPSYLTFREAQQYKREVIGHYIDTKAPDRLLFIKNHQNTPYFIDASRLHKVIYLVRNPLAIAPSLANHRNTSIDDTIKYMAKETAGFEEESKGINREIFFDQHIGSLNNHVLEWTKLNLDQLILVKYENLLDDPNKEFKRILKELNLDFKKSEIATAVSKSSFNVLKAKEKISPFREKNPKSKEFFRKGHKISWKKELTLIQKQKLIDQHQLMMKKLGYL